MCYRTDHSNSIKVSILLRKQYFPSLEINQVNKKDKQILWKHLKPAHSARSGQSLSFRADYRHKMRDPGESQVRETNCRRAHSNNCPNLGFISKLSSPWVKPMFLVTTRPSISAGISNRKLRSKFKNKVELGGQVII